MRERTETNVIIAGSLGTLHFDNAERIRCRDTSAIHVVMKRAFKDRKETASADGGNLIVVVVASSDPVLAGAVKVVLEGNVFAKAILRGVLEAHEDPIVQTTVEVDPLVPRNLR